MKKIRYRKSNGELIGSLITSNTFVLAKGKTKEQIKKEIKEALLEF